MKEVYAEMTTWYHLPLTVVMGFLLLYWLVSALGFVGEGMDLDLGGDVDADTGSSGALLFLLRFLNMDSVPVMIVVSIFVPFWWFASMFANHYGNPGALLLLGFLITGGLGIASLVFTKLATTPLARAIHRMREKDRETTDPIVGRTGTVRSGSVTGTSGQVEIAMRGEPLIIHARVRPGGEPLLKGAACVVTDQEPESEIFYITSFETPSLENSSKPN